MQSKKSSFKLAYVVKFSKNIGTDSKPDWVNYRVGVAFLDSKTGFLKVVLNLQVPQQQDGTWRLTLMPPLDEDSKGKSKWKKRKQEA